MPLLEDALPVDQETFDTAFQQYPLRELKYAKRAATYCSTC